MLELKDFIAETIHQISMGIKAASNKCKNCDVIVNPNVITGNADNYYIPKEPAHFQIERPVQKLEMEISIGAIEASEKGGNLRIGVFPINLGINGNKNYQTSNVNKIKFTIPICFPNADIKQMNDNLCQKNTEIKQNN